MRKRFLASLLSLCMVVGLLPTAALATAAEDPVNAGSATITLQQYDGSRWRTWNPENIDTATAAEDGVSFRYLIKINTKDYYESYIAPFVKDNGQFNSDDSPHAFTITLPANMFDENLTIDWDAIAAGANSIELVGAPSKEQGIKLQGKSGVSGAKTTWSCTYFDASVVTVPVTLSAENYAAAAAAGGISLNGTITVTGGASDANLSPLAFTAENSISVIDSNNLKTSLTITDGNGNTLSAADNFSDGAWNLTGGTYTVTGTAEAYEGLRLNGDVTLNLSDATINHTTTDAEQYAPAISVASGSVTLNLSGANTVQGSPGHAGIYVAKGATLTISGSGSLTATGGNSCQTDSRDTDYDYEHHAAGAGIGGNGYAYKTRNRDTVVVAVDSYDSPAFGTVIIESGTVNATGGAWTVGSNIGAGAGIGAGGTSSQSTIAAVPEGTVRITGGSVTAAGGDSTDLSETGGGAGIGAGGATGNTFVPYNSGVSVSISGGNVEATGKADGAGIGGGANVDGGSITITGGTVTATGGHESSGAYGGAGIGGGDQGGVTSIRITGGKVTATGGGAAPGIGAGNDGFVGTMNYNSNSKNYGTISIGGDADVTATGGSYAGYSSHGGAGIGAGRSYSYNNGCGSIEITGTAKVLAYGGTGANAIGVGSHYTGTTDPNSLKIADTVSLWAQTEDDTSALLTATSYESENNIYLVFNASDNKSNGYVNFPGSDSKEFAYTLDADGLTIDGDVVSAAAPKGTVGNWATLYAPPAPTTYTVTFEANGHGTAPETQTVQSGGTVTKPADLTETGYTFGGWYKEADCTNAWDFDDDTVTANTTLYAKWTINSYTVTFDTNGHGTAPEDQTVEYGGTVTKPDDLTETGYTFGGWYKEADCTNAWDFDDDTVTGNMTLYAKWNLNSTPLNPTAAAYQVEHYKEQLDGSYTLAETETLFGEINSTVTATVKTYAHYHHNPDAAGTLLSDTVIMPTTGENGAPQLLTLKVYYDLDTYEVRYDLNGGEAGDRDYSTVTVKYGATVTVKDAPDRSGYTFAGWSDGTTTYQPGAPLTVLGNITLTAQWHEDGGEAIDYILRYESGGGTAYPDERYEAGTVVLLDKVPSREGYQFAGWYADEGLTVPITSVTMDGDKTVYALWRAIVPIIPVIPIVPAEPTEPTEPAEPSGPTVPEWLNGEDHFAYIMGYADGTVRPNANISRAEAATIFFRLLKADIRDGNLTSANSFADVTEVMWCNKSISTMAALGIVKGRTAAAFDPDASITRAEFAAICARFDAGLTGGDSDFTDISGHWAEAEIKRAVSLGWIQGYEDGTFRPDQYITRAEAMTIINRVLCRIPENEDDLLDGMNIWPDNLDTAKWYYLAVQEATNSHDFRHKGEIYEHWLKLNEDPDWTRYQN